MLVLLQTTLFQLRNSCARVGSGLAVDVVYFQFPFTSARTVLCLAGVLEKINHNEYSKT